MTPQDYEDITILKHAAQDIIRYVGQLLEDTPPYDDLESEELIEKGKHIKRIGALISVIRDGGKHLPYGEENDDEREEM